MNRRADDIQQFFNLIASSMEICKKFCERIPGIGDINPGDRELLYQSASLELVILRMAYRYVVSFNTSYLTESYIVFTLKMESVSKSTIFGLKMMVKSGLEKFILKSLHAGRWLFLLLNL